MAGRRADIGIAQVKRRGFTFDLICLACRVADERSHPFSVANGPRPPPSPPQSSSPVVSLAPGREWTEGGAFGLQEDERRTITPCDRAGSRRQVRNRVLPINGIFFSLIPRASRRHQEGPTSAEARISPCRFPSALLPEGYPPLRGKREGRRRVTSGLRSENPFPAITVSEAARFKFDVNFDARSCRHSFNPLIALVNIGLSRRRFFAWIPSPPSPPPPRRLGGLCAFPPQDRKPV